MKTKRFLSIVVTLAVLLGMTPAVSLPVSAAAQTPANDPCKAASRNETTGTETAITGAAAYTYANQAVSLVGEAAGVVYDGYFFEGFENGLEEWTFVDSDGDGMNWYSLSVNDNTGLKCHSGECHLTSASYQVEILYPDNWAISPAVKVYSNSQLSFWIVGQDPEWAEENMAVYVGESTNIDRMTKVGGDYTASAEYTEYTVDLGAYAGKTIYIAFRHYNVSDMFRLNLDDVKVSGHEHGNYQLAVGTEDKANTLSCLCGNPGCSDPVYSLNLSINAPEKTSYDDGRNECATLTAEEGFEELSGLTPSEEDIVYYAVKDGDETKLDSAPTAAGDYTARLTLTKDGADYTIEVNYTIASKTFTSSAALQEGNTLVYTGQEQVPTLEVTDGEKHLTAGTDYDVIYVDAEENEYPQGPVEVGSYRAVLTFKGNYSGNTAVEFEIEPAQLKEVSVTQADVLIYNGEAQAPAVNTQAGSVNDQAVSFTYSKTENGTYGEMPTITDVSESGVFYFKASAPNHEDYFGTFTAVMSKADVELSYETTSVAKTTADAAFINPLTNEEEVSVSYSSSSDAATVGEDGTVTIKAAGMTTITASYAGDDNHNAASASYTLTVTEKIYTVTFDANGNGTAPEAQSVAYKAAAVKPDDPIVEGYYFGGWYEEAACTNEYDFAAAVTSDITLYAKWSKSGTLTTEVISKNINTPTLAVDGMEDAAEAAVTAEEKTKITTGKISVKVSLEAERKDEASAEGAAAIRKLVAPGSSVNMFLDLRLIKYVTVNATGETSSMDIGSGNTSVLRIRIPYNTARQNIQIIRYHDGEARNLQKLSEEPAGGYTDGTYFVGRGYVAVYASGFSTYAVADSGYPQNMNISPATGGNGAIGLFMAAFLAVSAFGMAVTFRARRRG